MSSSLFLTGNVSRILRFITVIVRCLHSVTRLPTSCRLSVFRSLSVIRILTMIRSRSMIRRLSTNRRLVRRWQQAVIWRWQQSNIRRMSAKRRLAANLRPLSPEWLKRRRPEHRRLFPERRCAGFRNVAAVVHAHPRLLRILVPPRG